jgi:peroxiredoxin
VAVHRRLLFGSLAVATVVAIGGGWALSRDSGSADPGDDVVRVDGTGATQDPTIGTNAKVSGEQLPDLEIVDNDGNTVQLADLEGTPLVINYWFSNCAPCKEELPAFAAVSAEFDGQVRFVGVNPSDSPEVNESFARERGVQYDLLRDPDGAYASTLGVSTAPFTLFVAADGTIVRQTGVLTADTLRSHVEALLS